jgi:hypothetical protein
MHELINNILFLLIPLGSLAIIIWGFARGNQILDKWAMDNGFRIIQREYKFFWNILDFPATNGQSVYRVTVVDNDGNEKSGLVRCGHWLLGILVNKVTVKWDR